MSIISSEGLIKALENKETFLVIFIETGNEEDNEFLREALTCETELGVKVYGADPRDNNVGLLFKVGEVPSVVFVKNGEPVRLARGTLTQKELSNYCKNYLF